MFTYNIFLLLWVRTWFDYLPGSPLTMKSIIIPSIFIAKKSSMLAFKYTPTMSAVATSLISFASITSVVTSDPVNTVGEDDSSLVIYGLYLLPSAHVLPFSQPHRFSFKKDTVRSASFFCWKDFFQNQGAPPTLFVQMTELAE